MVELGGGHPGNGVEGEAGTSPHLYLASATSQSLLDWRMEAMASTEGT
jgi:hypothetical protein